MNYEQFICAMLECTRNKLFETEVVERQEVLKNNGIVMVGLSIRNLEKNAAPVIYLDEYYNAYLKGRPLEDLSECLVEKSRKTPELPQWERDMLLDFSLLKDKIVYKLVNAQENEKLLKEAPNLPLLDFAIVFYLHLPISEAESGTILIRNEHLKLWNCPISRLYEYAKKNTPEICPPMLCPLTALIEAAGEVWEEECPIFVLTNETGVYGATAVLYQEIPQLIYQEVGGNYYLLPSSIHEFLIVPEKEDTVPGELRAIVREVNRTEIAKEEFLSDQIYYFNGEIITKM